VVATTTGDVEGREGGSLPDQWGWAVAPALESPLVLPPALAVAAGDAGAVATWQRVIDPFEFEFDHLYYEFDRLN
jgi:hypothetical protein